MVRHFDIRVLSAIRTSENAIGIFRNQSHQDALFAHGTLDLCYQGRRKESGVFPYVLRFLHDQFGVRELVLLSI
jgi:hypothetical protein